MKLTNLKDSPQYVQKTLNLIENSFGYENHNHFDVDFKPLFNPGNFQNCFVLIEDTKVIGHIGRVEKEFIINDESFKFSMLGGIAIHKDFQGKGIFKEFFKDILDKESATAFSLLWSDKVEMYKKFNFYPCIDLKVYSQNSTDHPSKSKYTKTKLSNLSKSHFNQLTSLYDNSTEVRVHRSLNDWKMISEIESADLYIELNQDNSLQNYFFLNKGQDLKEIIYEYGEINDAELNEMLFHGTVWTPYQSSNISYQNIFGSICKINDQDYFKKFIYKYTQIEIEQIKNDQVVFNFKDQRFEFSIEDFLTGVFGPARFKELEIPFINISGLDSV